MFAIALQLAHQHSLVALGGMAVGATTVMAAVHRIGLFAQVALDLRGELGLFTGAEAGWQGL